MILNFDSIFLCVGHPVMRSCPAAGGGKVLEKRAVGGGEE